VSINTHKIIQFIGEKPPKNWPFLSKNLEKEGVKSRFFCSDLTISTNWNTLKHADLIFIYFRDIELIKATIEIITRLDPNFAVESRLLVVAEKFAIADKIRFDQLGVLHFVDEKVIARASTIASQIKTTSNLQNTALNLYFKTRRLLLNQLISHDEAHSLLASIEENYDPTTAEYQNLLALISFNSGDYDKAETIWLTVLNDNERFSDALDGLAQVYERKKQFEKALAIHKKLDLISSNSAARLIQIANIHLRLMQLDKAEHHFRRALKIDRHYDHAIHGLAQVCFTKGYLEDCKKLLKRSKSADLTAAELNRIGVSLVSKSEYAKAISHYQDALYVLPTQNKGARLFYNISLALVKSGQLKSASTYLELALIKDANYEKAQNLLARIQDT
jgi:tetratricopeptide (TPR) repeat protein